MEGKLAKILRRKEKGYFDFRYIYVLEVNMITSPSAWVFDAACGTHIIKNVQELKNNRKLAKGEGTLWVGNCAKLAAIEAGIFNFCFPSDLVIFLNNFHLIPRIITNIISIPVLDQERFSFIINNGDCLMFKDIILYASGKLSIGLYILDLDKHIHSIECKRRKTNDHNPT